MGAPSPTRRGYRVGKRLIATLAAITLVCGVVLVTSGVADAGTGLRYQVVDADNAHDGGVYYRNSPSWNDTARITGVGGYYGETVELVCGAWGDAVGPYANRRWHLVDNLSRPAAGRGWLPDRYLNTPNNANEATPGEPECGASAPTPSPSPSPPPPGPAPIGKLVTYYSGLGNAGAQKARSLQVDRDLTADGTYDGSWTSATQCTPASNAVNFAGKDINRLAGWSLGRLGPIYALKYLKDHNPGAAARINYVIMFDPGAPADFGTCDYNQSSVQADSTLAWWLGLSSDNRLVILSGNRTATNHHQTIQTAYFPAIKRAGSAIRSRVLVCNYSLGHEAVYNNYADRMTAQTRLETTQGFSSCPKQGLSSVWGWNP